MTDRATEDELQALVDGRLAPERRAAVEQHLADDAALAARIAAYGAQREALRTQLRFKAEEPIPARLRIASIQAERRRVAKRRFVAMAAAVSWLALGAGIGWFGKDFAMPARETVVAADAIAAHRTFVVDATHPVEVDASREAHLVQWLSKRLGRPMKVPNLSALGFKLMGGRLLPTPEGVACQIMYDDEQGRRLTLYMRPGGAATETPLRFERDGSIANYSWLDRGGFGFGVTADTDAKRLRGIAESIQQQIGTAVSH
jgi:anti-sigma factor RsiW